MSYDCFQLCYLNDFDISMVYLFYLGRFSFV